MAVGSSFDQWQKDVFFAAAEEVQESADRLESTYRTWIRYNSDGFESEISDELLRELHAALGTAKWQLDEFERAVSLSHENCSGEDSKITRHREFVAAIGNQIFHIERSMSNLLVKEGKQPFYWVQLDEEERDDFANFLSGVPQTTREMEDKHRNHDMSRVQDGILPDLDRDFKETVTIDRGSKYAVEVAANEPSKSKLGIIAHEEQLNGHRRTQSTQDLDDWKITIADEEVADGEMEEMLSQIPSHSSRFCGFLRSAKFAAKSNWFGSNLRKAKSGEHLHMRHGLSELNDSKGITRFTQGINGLSERSRSCFSSCAEHPRLTNVERLLGRAGGFQKHVQGSQNLVQVVCSLRLTIFLFLTITLIGPLLLYST